MRTGVLVDLYGMLRQALRSSRESYSIKMLEAFNWGRIRSNNPDVADAMSSRSSACTMPASRSRPDPSAAAAAKLGPRGRTSMPEVTARDYDVDARRLMRVVRISRDLRFVWRLALFGTLVWGAFILTVERSVPEGSAQWARADADAGPGFIALLVVAGIALVAQLSVRVFGKAGKAAALLVPPIGPPAPTVAVSGADNVAGLLAAVRRNAQVGFGAITALLVITGIVVAVAVNAWPAFEGNHGRGGRVVTIGTDATVTSHTSPVGIRGSRGTVNTLHTRTGDADAVGATPHDGERWTVVHDSVSDTDSAYLVGGHAYLLNLFLGVAFLLLDLAIAWFIWSGIRRERRVRTATDYTSLADSYGALAAGGRASVTIGEAATDHRRRPIPPLTIVLGVG